LKALPRSNGLIRISEDYRNLGRHKTTIVKTALPITAEFNQSKPEHFCPACVRWMLPEHVEANDAKALETATAKVFVPAWCVQPPHQPLFVSRPRQKAACLGVEKAGKHGISGGHGDYP